MKIGQAVRIKGTQLKGIVISTALLSDTYMVRLEDGRHVPTPKEFCIEITILAPGDSVKGECGTYIVAYVTEDGRYCTLKNDEKIYETKFFEKVVEKYFSFARWLVTHVDTFNDYLDVINNIVLLTGTKNIPESMCKLYGIRDEHFIKNPSNKFFSYEAWKKDNKCSQVVQLMNKLPYSVVYDNYDFAHYNIKDSHFA